MAAFSLSYRMIIIAVAGILYLQPLEAEIFRWVDENGQIHYSDRLPPQYSQLERKVYSAKGRLKSTINPPKTEKELEAERQRAKLAEEELKKIQEKQDRDRTLLRMFTSVEEMQSTRDDRIVLFDSRIAILEKKLKKLRLEQSELELRLGRIDTMDASQAKRIRHHQNEIADRIKSIEEQRSQEIKNKINTEARFAADIERFIELTQEQKP